MQTIVNLVSAGIGVAWVPESVMQFRRQGVVYRVPDARRRKGLPGATPVCETSLVWRGPPDGARVAPALSRFVDFVRAQLAG